MSILIKGMAMPRKCQSCLLYKPYAGNGFCLMAGKRLIYNETPSNPKGAGRFCPLVELPERHGRLIEADAFAEHLRESAENFGTFAPQMAMALEAAVRDLEDPKKTPTIVEAEGKEDGNDTV